MEKRNIVIRYFVLVMLMVAFVACASTSKQESTGEYVDDSVITTKVKSLLAADDFLKASLILKRRSIRRLKSHAASKGSNP